MELILRAAVLLLLLSRCEAAEETCGLTGQVKEGHLDKVLGVRWVKVRAFSDFENGLAVLRKSQSTVLLMEMMEDNVTVACVERNVEAEKCLVFYTNMTTPEDKTSNHTLVLMNTGVEANDTSCIPYEDQGKYDIYSSCDDCMTLIYHMTWDNVHCRMLQFFRREGKHTDSEELKASEQQIMETAKCLKFNTEYHFTYNGTAGFCEKNKVHRGDECFLS
ncbi:saxitoxin and tetrodotoxin-binding protein 1-like [Gouania willdenowi]|uniref:saxitoxin and tetrodotoxin-binding protein 1-like n=1 Tax=Gouania willdenowi TaxID=441366 RepID=UPI0010541E00|nr:saxitoxin and tetrodotoxin-binding protein 1-like [Gouania willdenowi]